MNGSVDKLLSDISVTFVGGPLDGRTVTRGSRRRGRWPAYVDDDGNPISPAQGDSELTHRRLKGLLPRRFYRYQLDLYNGRHVYVHLTCYADWLAEQRRGAEQ